MMQKNSYKVVGVMSGTSLDGIDLAEMTFSLNNHQKWEYSFGTTETIPYNPSWVAVLKEGIHFSAGRLQQLNNDYTLYLADVISSFIQDHRITALDAICSHGHTILHQPQKGITLQIGNLPSIAERLAQTVVCDFRVQDVVLGGQGAPLVPIGDRLLFSNYDYCLNLGGFANASNERNGKRFAYDICPVNIVLNSLTEELGIPYDDGGAIARNGEANDRLLEQLNALAFYQLGAPKSLGLEWVQAQIFPLLNASDISIENKIATFTEHVAYQLSQQFAANSTVLVTGGGAYNTFLLERLGFYKKLDVTIPDPQLLEFKEALIFGLLGVLKLRDEVNCLASVTGASRDHSGGIVYKIA